jgi:hypothetical protein
LPPLLAAKLASCRQSGYKVLLDVKGGFFDERFTLLADQNT